jgi:hypothetical protein
MRRTWLLATAVVALCSGCSQSIQFTLPDSPLNLSRTVSGAMVKRCSIKPDSEQYKALSAWLVGHQNGWQGSVVTYVPSVVLTGKGFNLNLLPSLAVLNYAGKQLTHQVLIGDFAFLVCAGNS